MTDKRIGSDGGGIQHHGDSSRSGFAGPKVLPDGPNWLDPRDATRRLEPGEVHLLAETEREALDWEEDDEETAMWSHRHLAPRASVLSPKLSSQRDAIARRFRQREALYASSRHEGSQGPDDYDSEMDDGAEHAGEYAASPPQAQKRYVYRSHLPLEPEDFVPTLAEPMHLAPLPRLIDPDLDFSADATDDFDLDEALPDDHSDSEAWPSAQIARAGVPPRAAQPGLQQALTQPLTQQPAGAAYRRTPTVDYPQMRPLHQTFAPSPARPAAQRPRSAPEAAAAQPPRGPRRGTPPMGVMLRPPQRADARPEPQSPPAQPAIAATPAPPRAHEPSVGAPQTLQARPRHTHTVRFVAAQPERAPQAASVPAAPRPPAATQGFDAQRAFHPAPAHSYSPPQPQPVAPGGRGRDLMVAQRPAASQPIQREPHAQPAPIRPAGGRRATPPQQFVATRQNAASYGATPGATLHGPPPASRGAQLAQPSSTRPIARQASPQPQLARARMNTVSYEDLPGPASRLAASPAAARSLRDTVQRSPTQQPSSAHAFAQLGHPGPEAQPVRGRLSRVARKDARHGQPPLVAPRAPLSMQPEPPTLRGLQPGSLHQTHSGLQPQFQTRRSQPAQLRAEPQHRPAPVQMYAVQPQPVSAPVVEPPRRLAQPAPALAPMPQAWSTFDDEAPFEPRRSGRGRHWLLGGMTAAGLLGSVVIGRLLLSSPTPATLAVETLPFDASVTIDGRPLPGTRSPYRAQDLQAGEHLLVVQKPGFVTHTERVSLREGEERRLATLVLSPNPPPAAIPSEPIAAAAPLPTDDATQPDRPRRRGRSLDTDEPRERPERSASARSSAREDEATRSTDSSAESDADERASKRRQSDDEPSAASDHSAPAGERLEDGMLRINSRPWAEVYVDGKRVGTTPQMGLRLRAGQHKVELINPELDMRKSVVVDIEPGELVTRIVTLQE